MPGENGKNTWTTWSVPTSKVGQPTNNPMYEGLNPAATGRGFKWQKKFD
jgi:hypothetical protein